MYRYIIYGHIRSMLDHQGDIATSCSPAATCSVCPSDSANCLPECSSQNTYWTNSPWQCTSTCFGGCQTCVDPGNSCFNCSHCTKIDACMGPGHCYNAVATDTVDGVCQIAWDETLKTCTSCYSFCATCDGPTASDCLTCFSSDA
jgi:hypothetical protein